MRAEPVTPKWDEHTAEEHVGDIQELLKHWQEYHSKKKKD